MKFQDVNKINQLIKLRRSVFPAQYNGEEVDDAIIKQMLENANWAPTHKFTEPWRFVVFKGEGRKSLGAFQAEHYKKVTKVDGTFSEKKYENLKQKPLTASHIIAIGMRRDPDQSINEVEEIASVACAVQNMYLTATAYGVGCYWSTGGITYFEDVNEFFGLAPQDRLMGYFFVGIPEKWPVTSKRSSIEEKVKWVVD